MEPSGEAEFSDAGLMAQNECSSENEKDVGEGQLVMAMEEEYMNDQASSANQEVNNSMAHFHGSRSGSHIGRKPAFGQTCSMKTLLQDGILETGEKVLTLEFEGQKFFGDLRKDGTIEMRGSDDSNHIYATPVAWANYCCKMLNPESKPLNAWSSIRFKGKRLDSYKLKWYRAQKKPTTSTPNNHINHMDNSIMLMGGVNMNIQNNSATLNTSIIRNLQQQQNQLANNRLKAQNPITNYFPQYENPIKNKKLIKSVLISNTMDNDCKRLVAKSLDMSVDPCLISQQMNYNNSTNNISNLNNNIANNQTNNLNSNNHNNINSNNEETNVIKNDAQIDSDETTMKNGSLSEGGLNNDCSSADANDDNSNLHKTNNDNINNNNNNHVTDNNCTKLKMTVINYEQLGTRGPHNTHDLNTMIKCIPFSAVDRIQPFNVTVSTNALLLVDFHSHLVNGEVAGYLAGEWDVGQHVLTIKQAFPCRAALDDGISAAAVEEEIRQDIEKRNLTLVGWYHSHQGKYSNHPTIKDIQNQIEYQITMKDSPAGYTPCVGLICSPHDIRSDDDLSPSFQIYWVMPPPEHLTNHFGRPMQMYYSVTRDLFLTQDLLLEMRLLANYYTSKSAEMVDFKAQYENNDKITNLDKLSGSIKPKLPKDLQESEYPDEPAIWKAAVDHFWKFLHNLVVASNEQSAIQDQKNDTEDVRDEPE